MKTLSPTSACLRLSQSEAMLEAMEAGFFEVFFDKNELMGLLSSPRCNAIRFSFRALPENKVAITAIAIDRQGSIANPFNGVIATREIPVSQKDENPVLKKNACCVDFGCGDLLQLLSAPDCTGIRLFPGLLRKNKPTLIAVGVNSRGFDIAWGTGYLRSSQVFLPTSTA